MVYNWKNAVASTIAVVLVACASAATAAPAASFADLADLVSAAPTIVKAEIDKTEKLKSDEAGSAAAGQQRLLMTARVTAALRAPAAVQPQLTYIWDAPVDARGRVANFKGMPVLLFLRPGAARPDQLQLVGARAQLPWDATTEASVRTLLRDIADNQVPVITGIGAAFRVAGSVPGEAESQYFLTTQDGKPVSLVLLSRPGVAPQLNVALGDVIDDAARPITPDSLLWYRFACFLPATLPASLQTADEPALSRDYAAVLAIIGRCDRTKS